VHNSAAHNKTLSGVCANPKVSAFLAHFFLPYQEPPGKTPEKFKNIGAGSLFLQRG